MLISYYFDTDKKHKLNFGIQIKSFKLSGNNYDMSLVGYIEEWINNIRVKREEKNGNFQLKLSEVSKHDLDLIRTRYANEKKWIFEIINNKNNTQRLLIGLISGTANKNPIGVDIYNDETQYNLLLKGNNLSQIEDTYKPPVITQTIGSLTFDTEGYPNGFSSLTASYNKGQQLFDVKDFKFIFSEPIPEQCEFHLEMDIAPSKMIVPNSDSLIWIHLDGVGDFQLTQSGIVFKNGETEISGLFESELSVTDFYDNGFKPKSRFIIEGDGKGNLSFCYAGVEITAPYNHLTSHRYVELKYNILPMELDIYKKLDNLFAYFKK